MDSSPTRVGVVLGGVAPEHEVSVISALQAAHALDRDRYAPLPLYIAKDGTWYTGDALLDVATYRDQARLRDGATPLVVQPDGHGRLVLWERPDAVPAWRAARRFTVDVMLLGLHGGAGEDGGLQGLCETFNVPYTGSGVLGSAVGMDKVLSKKLCRTAGVPVVDFVSLREDDWAYQEEARLDECAAALGYPVIVKPARCGSSIGIAKATTREALDAAIEDAFRYDDKVIVERAVTALREINCAVLGDQHEVTTSVLEEPVASEDAAVLSFKDKYMREQNGSDKAGGAKQGPAAEGMAALDRIIPAELSAERTKEIQDMAQTVFQLFECAGVARIDFMIDEATDALYFNEINTIPGSFSFYLWEPSGVPFDELVHRMIEIAQRRHRERNGRVRTYDVNLLAARDLGGLKGSKTQRE
ncbi:D-alanine--D-alanine ligase family protein [Salisaeta longa]|uniref:D-alanine--D-alanine ligase family protein n=1 Tax=Salisaeta longa TaxID=503170 RepID=UPI0003B4215B|nr:D-alanine--D-alanine ligase family protein [Salisaeta longa]